MRSSPCCDDTTHPRGRLGVGRRLAGSRRASIPHTLPHPIPSPAVFHTTGTDSDQNRYYRPSTPNSSVWPKPTSAPAAAVPLARAEEATASATAGATSRLNTEGMM